MNEAAEEFKELGYIVKICDGYRPPKVSERLWKLMPDPNFIADPKDGGSRYNRGCAVDLTLIDEVGNEVDMGTYFCEFSKKAYRDCQDLPDEILKNRKFLEMIMEKHGFKNWLQYPLLDVSLDK